ncbi:MAG: type II toxin-antitoxin system VapC family toxin [Candidatus Sulfotelmatobacter sp.]|jgi:PIN domain nuclease of toxin-antitoxin system
MILLDTHVVIWLALEPGRISRRARAMIEEVRSHGLGLAISDISLLEIAAIVSKGRVTLNASLETFLSEIEARFAVLPMTGRVCARAQELPARYPRDPADRVIGATSLVEGIPLVTADQEIRRSKALLTVW